MADFTADNILFGSSFDSTGFVAGVTKSIDSLRNLSAEQKKLQSAFDATNDKLLKNQSELTKTQRVYDNLKKGSTDYVATQTQLKTKIDELKAAGTTLNATWDKQKAALDAFNATNATAIASFNKLTAAQKELAATAAKPVVPVLDPTQITGQLQNLHTELAGKIDLGGIDFSGFDELHTKLSAAGTDVQQLSIVINEAKEKLATLKPGTQEFDELNQVVQTGEQFLKDYNKALEETGKQEDTTGEKTVSLRTRIKLLRDEMARLEDAGKENTEQYKKVQLEAARLTDQFADQQEQIKALSSDTKALDFGLAAINAAGAGMQVFLGVVNLLGLSEEDAAEAQRKLLAVMNLVQGAQQLQNLLLKEGTLKTLGATAATRAYAVVNGFLTTSFGAAATAATALRGVLITTGIGALVVGLGFLIAKLVQMQQESAKAAAKQKLLNDTLEEAKGEYTKAVVEVDTFKEHLRLAKEGVIDKTTVLKEYNEGLGKTMGAVTDLDAAERKVAEGGAAYIQFTLLKAAANIALGKAAEKAFEAEQERRKSEAEFATIASRAATFGEGQVTAPGFVPGLSNVDDQIKARAVETQKRKDEAVKEREDSQKELTDLVTSLNNQAAELAKQFHFDFIPTVKVDKEKIKKGVKEIEDVFKEQLLAMQAQLAEINKSSFVSADTIAAKVEADFQKAKERILDFFKKKQLTKDERDTLLEFLGVIKQAQLSKDMAEFTKNVLAARKQLEDQLDQLAFDRTAKNIANIQDSFERETQQNKIEFEKQTAELIKANEDQQKAIQDNIFLSQDEKNAQIAERQRILNDDLLALQVKYGNDQRDTALKFLEQSLDDVTSVFDERSLRTSELEQASIKRLTTDYTNGEISYKQYQDRLSKILKEAEDKRKASEIDEVEKRIKILQDVIARGTITDKTGVVSKLNEEQIKKLQKEIEDLRKQLIALNQIPVIGNPDTSGLDKWLNAYKTLTEGILGFIQQINSAEQDRLNRSIALQQTRVENARFIAEKGNAEYLELEQKRLDELIRKREAAANKELAINNALAASNAIVAAISAIAKSGDVITGLAAAVAVLAAIASIYKFVNSLQPPVAEFAEGTTYVQQGKHKAGKDTIPARLSIGEAVIPTDTNKAYNPAVKAIYERSVPAKELNDFVEMYPVRKEKPKESTPNKVLKEFVKEYSKEKDITKQHNVSTNVLNEFVKFYKSEEHSSYNQVLNKFVEQHLKKEDTSKTTQSVSAKVLNEFVKHYQSREFENFVSENSINNVISVSKLKEFAKDHEHSILNEFVRQTDKKIVSVSLLNEFVKSKQDSLNKIHENFISNNKNISTDKIKEFVKHSEHSNYANVLNEFLKQTDISKSKSVSVNKLNEFVNRQNESAINKVHEQFISENTKKDNVHERFVSTNNLDVKNISTISTTLEKLHENFISDKKSLSTEVIKRFIDKYTGAAPVQLHHFAPQYANILNEYLKQTDVSNKKTISVKSLNEFVKNYQSVKNIEQKQEHILKEFENIYSNISTVENKSIEQYYPAVKAIQEKSIPATAINEFVRSYTTEFVKKYSTDFVRNYSKTESPESKPKVPVNEVVKVSSRILNEFVTHYPVVRIPQIDYQRLQIATEQSYQKDFSRETNKKLDKVAELLSQLNENVGQFDNTKITFDENGFALSMLRAAKKQKILLKS